MAKKKTAELTPDEVVHGAEDAGLVSHEEAEEIIGEGEVQGEMDLGDDSDVKRPTLTGTNKLPKPDFEQPGSDNQSRTVIEE